MQNIVYGQDVAANPSYVSCEQGTFNDYDFVICKLKLDAECIVMFLAYQINTDNESSI